MENTKARITIELFIQVGEGMESLVRRGHNPPPSVKEELGVWLSQASQIWLMDDLTEGQNVRLSRSYDVLYNAYMELSHVR